MKKIIICCITLSVLATSCNKWLDVTPNNQSTASELFKSYSGFCDALNGCYIKLKDRSIYGERLTMTNIESMAQLWRPTSINYLPADYELMNFNYSGDNAKAALSTIYSSLYNVIAQANMIIKHIEENGSVFPNPATRSVIEGEAYAIRAFCHFDILRLFGQLPKNATIQVSLPYAERVSTSDLPSYYNYDQFIVKIESDFKKAESLLENNDPIFSYTFNHLNTFDDLSVDDVSLDDEFMGYRQNRFNYWAVKALLARFYLYTGNGSAAYTAAKEIVNAKGVDDNPLITLSGLTDIPYGFYVCPSEALLMLNSYSLIDYTPSVLGTGSSQIRTSHYVITQSQLSTLFTGQDIASNNRYTDIWSQNTMDVSGVIYPSLRKYYHDPITFVDSYDLTKRQVIPLIRLSEIYLILLETTNNLIEANNLWKEYQLSHNVLITENSFSSLEELRAFIPDEYRREFYGEGQMFFTYKRLGAPSMLWRINAVSESDYIAPLPETEFNPNN
ncbi:MAG: RagB/SusD family nutrient uptake outer membrane protein [Bacteroidales bacterium]|nr:RagB/SusD family nutrient uptake outer membrane protein [Bacteroidales bacterium]